ncbi:hypothetical protein [Lysobacter gummosus]|uniref:hypothetical protein n=1 Tax=Lysobacter gummosus TaxID=262324 RepID=UPI00363F6741
MTQAPHKRWPLPGHCDVRGDRGALRWRPRGFSETSRPAAGLARRACPHGL